jgi:hypothetical protein
VPSLWRAAAAEERRQHLLQAGDQVIGLAAALGQVFNLVVLDADLSAKELVFAFQQFDRGGVRRDRPRQVFGCRRWSSVVGACRTLLSRLFVFVFHGDIGRGQPRLAMACRTSFMYAMCVTTEAGVTRYFSPDGISTLWQTSLPLAQ